MHHGEILVGAEGDLTMTIDYTSEVYMETRWQYGYLYDVPVTGNTPQHIRQIVVMITVPGVAARHVSAMLDMCQ